MLGGDGDGGLEEGGVPRYHSIDPLSKLWMLYFYFCCHGNCMKSSQRDVAS